MSNPIKLNPISVPKISDVLAGQLRDAILRGEVAEGDMLPPERELVAQSGLSRGAVREALRVLSAEGLIQTRLGRFGGTIVTLPGNTSMATVVDQFVRGRNISMGTLQETREQLEPGLARLAALKRSDDDVRKLTHVHEAFEASVNDYKAFSQYNIKWHDLVARASGNDLLYAMWFGLSHAVSVATTAKESEQTDRLAAIRAHAQINAAIVAGDGELAEKRMRAHIRATGIQSELPSHADIPLFDTEA